MPTKKTRKPVFWRNSPLTTTPASSSRPISPGRAPLPQTPLSKGSIVPVFCCQNWDIEKSGLILVDKLYKPAIVDMKIWHLRFSIHDPERHNPTYLPDVVKDTSQICKYAEATGLMFHLKQYDEEYCLIKIDEEEVNPSRFFVVSRSLADFQDLFKLAGKTPWVKAKPHDEWVTEVKFYCKSHTTNHWDCTLYTNSADGSWISGDRPSWV